MSRSLRGFCRNRSESGPFLLVTLRGRLRLFKPPLTPSPAPRGGAVVVLSPTDRCHVPVLLSPRVGPVRLRLKRKGPELHLPHRAAPKDPNRFLCQDLGPPKSGPGTTRERVILSGTRCLLSVMADHAPEGLDLGPKWFISVRAPRAPNPKGPSHVQCQGHLLSRFHLRRLAPRPRTVRRQGPWEPPGLSPRTAELPALETGAAPPQAPPRSPSHSELRQRPKTQ
jgi:hypothetical protein